MLFQTLRVQVPNNSILTQNLYYNYYYPKPKYLIIGYLDPLGKGPGTYYLQFPAWHAFVLHHGSFFGQAGCKVFRGLGV